MWLRRLRRTWLFFLVFYLVICAGMWFLENRLVYHPETASQFWQDPPTPEIREVSIPTDGREPTHGWYLPCPDSNSAILYCHGNGGNLCYYGKTAQRLRDEFRCSVLLFDYPGYGKTPGKPSEAGCYATAEASLNWLSGEAGIPSHEVMIYGDSLGGGVATELASRHRFKLVLLAKTFTSIPAVGKRRFPWLPVHTLMRNRFDNLEKIPRCVSPIFIAGATNDGVVPFEHSEELVRAATSPTHFRRLEGQGHNDPLPDGFYSEVRAFLERLSRKD